ncbi:MAG: hypothetical protein HC871_14980 [Rhizobiales bacterium]|nr:hypothetical protein [Hyphomicrobiales bacterium]
MTLTRRLLTTAALGLLGLTAAAAFPVTTEAADWSAEFRCSASAFSAARTRPIA